MPKVKTKDGFYGERPDIGCFYQLGQLTAFVLGMLLLLAMCGS
ncbi:MAG: hypothetical protein AAF624_12780 [Bacteroidota bacterium]